MLRKFAVALIATSMFAGAAFAAAPSGNDGSKAPITYASNQTDQADKSKSGKHVRKHARKHVGHRHAHGKLHGSKTAHHFKSGKTHKVHVTHPKKGPKTAARLPAADSRGD